MGPGVDPHGYIAAARDIEKIQAADLVLYNGLDLEAKIADLLESMGSKSFCVGESLPEHKLLAWEGHTDLKDPHVWNDLELWEIAIINIKEELKNFQVARDKLYIPEPDAETGVIEQFDAYYKLEDVSVEEVKKRKLHPDEYLLFYLSLTIPSLHFLGVNRNTTSLPVSADSYIAFINSIDFLPSRPSINPLCPFIKLSSTSLKN